MSWNAKPVYPSGAVHTITVKATYAQRIAWQEAARKYRKGTAGGFLSFAAAFTIAILNALETMEPWPGD
jgi:hypothetical protein